MSRRKAKRRRTRSKKAGRQGEASAPLSGRTCGDCQACCWALPVYPDNDRSKLPMTGEHAACAHQCEAGCAIYAQRPKPCAIYQCMWLRGWADPVKDRPDRLGLVFEVNSRQPDICFVDEVRPGAAREPRGEVLLLAVREQVPMVILHRYQGGRELVNPTPEVLAALDAAGIDLDAL